MSRSVTRSVTLVMLLTTWSGGTTALAATVDGGPHFEGKLTSSVEDLLNPAGGRAELPQVPTSALIESVSNLSAALGRPQDPTEPILESNLSAELAGRLSQVLDGLLQCQDVSSNILTAMGGTLDFSAVPEAGSIDALRSCADRTHAQSWLAAGAASKAAATRDDAIELDVWPVIRVDTSAANNTYEHDYALIVDAGGSDTYSNNAGGNLLDVRRGPAGLPPPPEVGPARGCERILPDLTNGDCVIGAAALIDTDGDDTYGVRQAPRPDPYDGKCTTDTVIRRFVTEGAGFAGVGILLDTVGADAYTGKTISQGAGHVGGVGILVDGGTGNDTYSAVRNSQGFSLVGATGILDDHGGADSYSDYMPAGGVVNDVGNCDSVKRFVQGAANTGGIGVLINRDGIDSYTTGDSVGRGQGFGSSGGFGVFIDDGGDRDSYSGVSGRQNGISVLPTSISGFPAFSTSIFVDTQDET